MRAHEFSVATKGQAYKRCLKGDVPHCECCGFKIIGTPEYDHIVPVGLSGKSEIDNCQVLCGKCHRIKTHLHDRPVMAKADKSLKSNRGIKRKHVWPKRKFGQ